MAIRICFICGSLCVADCVMWNGFDKAQPVSQANLLLVCGLQRSGVIKTKAGTLQSCERLHWDFPCEVFCLYYYWLPVKTFSHANWLICLLREFPLDYFIDQVSFLFLVLDFMFLLGRVPYLHWPLMSHFGNCWILTTQHFWIRM